MKQLIFVLLISCLACANNQAGQAERKKDMESTKEIYLAGGCFWGTEHFLKLIDGVETTQVGYANGNIANPTYKQVCTGTTDFAETVKVQYDPLKVDLPFLIDLYFKTIDPTSVNRQGNDKGTQYRTGIYYTDPADLAVIQETVHRLATAYSRPLAVEIKPITRIIWIRIRADIVISILNYLTWRVRLKCRKNLFIVNRMIRCCVLNSPRSNMP